MRVSSEDSGFIFLTLRQLRSKVKGRAQNYKNFKLEFDTTDKRTQFVFVNSNPAEYGKMKEEITDKDDY